MTKIAAEVKVDMTWPAAALLHSQGRSTRTIPWARISRMATTFTRRAMTYERALQGFRGSPKYGASVKRAEKALTVYAERYATLLAKYNLKIGSN